MSIGYPGNNILSHKFNKVTKGDRKTFTFKKFLSNLERILNSFMRCCICVIAQIRTHCLQSGSFSEGAAITLHCQIKNLISVLKMHSCMNQSNQRTCK